MNGATRSISRHLSAWLVLLTLLGLGMVSIVIYSATAMRLHASQQEALDDKRKLLGEFVRLACLKGETELRHKLSLFEPVRSGTRLELTRGDGSLLYRDEFMATTSSVAHLRSTSFQVAAPEIPGGTVNAVVAMDVSRDEHMLAGLAVTLLVTTLVGATLTGAAMYALVRRDLRPLALLAAQTRRISPQRLDQRLELDRPAEELQPLIEQFNGLMGRLERAYTQLEGFNADVAHELRTPLATLIGETEVALSRDRSADSLRETLVSNLEEMQRLSALVNDMLFLSHADRGAVARRGQPVSLATLAQQVVEFHEAPLEDAGLQLRVEGDATVPVDEPLFKRALSNLLGNATRFAERGSTVLVRIAPQQAPSGEVQVVVQNQGQPITAQQLPRLFDRFFRGDVSRCCPNEQHHGLGLAIVAAIARMHAGRTLAEHEAGVTRVGFTLATTG